MLLFTKQSREFPALFSYQISHGNFVQIFSRSIRSLKMQEKFSLRYILKIIKSTIRFVSFRWNKLAAFVPKQYLKQNYLHCKQILILDKSSICIAWKLFHLFVSSVSSIERMTIIRKNFWENYQLKLIENTGKILQTFH